MSIDFLSDKIVNLFNHENFFLHLHNLRNHNNFLNNLFNIFWSSISLFDNFSQSFNYDVLIKINLSLSRINFKDLFGDFYWHFNFLCVGFFNLNSDNLCFFLFIGNFQNWLIKSFNIRVLYNCADIFIPNCWEFYWDFFGVLGRNHLFNFYLLGFVQIFDNFFGLNIFLIGNWDNFICIEIVGLAPDVFHCLDLCRLHIHEFKFFLDLNYWLARNFYFSFFIKHHWFLNFHNFNLFYNNLDNLINFDFRFLDHNFWLLIKNGDFFHNRDFTVNNHRFFSNNLDWNSFY